VFDKEKEFLNYSDSMGLLMNFIFTNSSFIKKEIINDVLYQFLENLKYPYNVTPDEFIYIGYLKANTNGTIQEGLYLHEDEKNNESYAVYKNGELIKKEKSTIEDFQKIILKHIDF